MLLFSGSHEDADREKQRQQAVGRCTMCIFALDYVSRHKTKLFACVCEVPREWHTHELLQQTHNKDEINALSAGCRWTSGLWPWYQHYLPQPGNFGHSTNQRVSWCDAQNKMLPGRGGGGDSAQSKQNKGPSKMIPSWSWTVSILMSLLLEIRLFSIPSPYRSTVERHRKLNATMWNLFR